MYVDITPRRGVNKALSLLAMGNDISDLSIQSAMDNGSMVRAPVVNMKVRKNGKKSKTLDVIRTTTMPEIGNTVVKIINDCDPAGFLSDVVNGKAIECHIVLEDGTVQTIYETPTLNKRIEVAKFLAERYMPKIAVVKHAHLHKTLEDSKEKQGQTNYEQMVTHAANSSDSPDPEGEEGTSILD